MPSLSKTILPSLLFLVSSEFHRPRCTHLLVAKIQAVRMSKDDVTAGLVLPNAAIALLGKGGAAATLLLVFMAVTSASSAEFVAVSSIVTYDIYQPYYHPDSKGTRLITVSHTSVIVYAIILAGFSTGLYYAGISMGYLYLLMGVIISSAVLPSSLTLLWSQQSWAAATFSPVLGLICSLIAWLVTAKAQGGGLNVTSTGSNIPMLAGNVVALLSPIVFVPILTLIGGPQNYDWVSMARIRKTDDSDVARRNSIDLELVPGESPHSAQEEQKEQAKLLRASKIARWLTLSLALSLLVIWPMPMYGSKYVFSKQFFTGWITVGFIWLFCSAACVVIYPVWEGRRTSSRVFREVFRDLTGKGGRRARGAVVMEGKADKQEEGVQETEPEKMDIKS